MKCKEIECLLSPYLDDRLSAEEKDRVEKHIAVCKQCGSTFSDLKKAAALVQGLKAVEPPAFLEQRIMARIREEDEREKGFLRRLFSPLYVKIPIQVMTTIFIAIASIYVYQANVPETQEIVPLPKPVIKPESKATGGKTKNSEGTVNSGANTKNHENHPVNTLNQREEEFPQAAEKHPDTTSYEKGAIAEKAEKSPAREIHPTAVQSPSHREKIEARNVYPFALTPNSKSEHTLDIVEKRQDFADGSEFNRVSEALPMSNQKMKLGSSGVEAKAEKNDKMAYSAAPSRSTMESVIGLTIRVHNTIAAIRELETNLGPFNARIIDRQYSQEIAYLKMEIESRNLAAFMNHLKKIGSITLEKDFLSITNSNLIVDIKIIHGS